MAIARIVLRGESPAVEGLHGESATILSLGCAGPRDLVLDDPSVSPHHADIASSNHGWFVYDRNSRHGTFVNGEPVGPGGHRLYAQDVLRCGDLALRVTVLEEAQPEALKTSSSFVRIRTVAHRSWQQALEVFALHIDEHLHQGRHLLALLRAGHHLCNVGSVDDLMQSVLDDAVAVLNAQRGAMVLTDDATGELHLRAVSVPKQARRPSHCFSRTLAQRCVRLGESLLCQDINDDAALRGAQSTARDHMASIICALLRSPRKRLGVLHLDRGPFQDPFTEADFYLADAIAASVSAGIESAQLVDKRRSMFLETLTALARAVELRDQCTGNHTQRVTDYALMLAGELGLGPGEREQIRIGTPLHDIGKIGIADAVLRKPDQLTYEEFEHMKTHTIKGAEILADIPGLSGVLPIVRHHHERWDGDGYPDHLAEEAIAPTARVVAVADAFDAMTSDRPYRKALSLDYAFTEIEANAGSHFDPACAQAFRRLRPRIEARPRGLAG